MTLSLERQNRYRTQYRASRPDWRPATEVYESLLRACLRPDSWVVDVGCGRGGVLEQLGEAAAHPIGLDPDLGSLREHRVRDLPRAAAFSDALPLCAGSVDLVACSWVLEHLIDPARTFAEVARVLRSGGAFVFLTPNAESLVVWLNRLLRPLQKLLVSKLYGRAESDTFPVQYRANTPRQLLDLAARAGLRCDSLHQIEDPTYLAFHPLLYRISVTLARITPPVHLTGVLVKD